MYIPLQAVPEEEGGGASELEEGGSPVLECSPSGEGAKVLGEFLGDGGAPGIRSKGTIWTAAGSEGGEVSETEEACEESTMGEEGAGDSDGEETGEGELD